MSDVYHKGHNIYKMCVCYISSSSVKCLVLSLQYMTCVVPLVKTEPIFARILGKHRIETVIGSVDSYGRTIHFLSKSIDKSGLQGLLRMNQRRMDSQIFFSPKIENSICYLGCSAVKTNPT